MNLPRFKKRGRKKMGPRNKLEVCLLAALASMTTHAMAESSLTFYGLADAMVTYQNNQAAVGSTSGGRPVAKLGSGAWSGSRFGFKGVEDMGGGKEAILVLEAGMNMDTGAAQLAGTLFGRQAFLGYSDPAFGKVTLGRQYTAYYLQLAPYSPTTWTTGYFGAHPGDVDALDTILRANNTLMYTTPALGNVTAAASYSLGEAPGSVNQGSTWSLGLQYKNGPFGIAGGYMRVNNSTPGGGAWGANSSTNSGGQPLVSAVTNGYQTAAEQQRVTLGSAYAFTPALDLSVTASNVQYRPGSNSLFANTAVFNILGSVLHYHLSGPWDVAIGYSYTRATKANGIENAATYKQVTLSQYYSLSKRTALYALESFQRSGGKTLGTAGASSIIDATPTIGDGFNGAPSSSNTQSALGVGIIHRF
jgi:predicted porin